MIYLYLLYTYWSFFYHNMRPIGDIPFAQEMERLKPGNLVLGRVLSIPIELWAFFVN